jgi:hypothetical protein
MPSSISYDILRYRTISSDILRYRTISSDILCGRRFVAIIPDDLPPSTGIVDIMEEVAAFHQAFPQYATSGGRMQVLLPRPPV